MRSREHLHLPANVGERIADVVAARVGSWPFIITQSCFLAAWIILNTIHLIYHWDPAPFILLNLCLSFQAAYTGPIVMLSQNRQAQKDRQRDDLESVEVSELHTMNKQQLIILQQQSEILELLKAGKP